MPSPTMLIPLHVKSHYSLGCGTAPVGRLVERAAALGLPALGLTDIENLYGQVLFHRLAREKGLRPITGVELREEDHATEGDRRAEKDRHAPGTPGDAAPPARALARPPRASEPAARVVLLAQDRAGYENLCRIITRRRLDGAGDPLESLRGRAQGLFLLTDQPDVLERLLSAGVLDPACGRLLLVRPSRSETAERRLLAAAARRGGPRGAAPARGVLAPEDRAFHQLQVAIGRNALVADIAARELDEGPGRHFPGPRECERLFADLPEAVLETHRLAERCELELLSKKHVFPRLTLPAGETSYSHLARTAFRRLEERYREIAPRHLERLTAELHLIERLGFCEYFLVVGDIVRFARERGIEVVGRGSGAGSLVAHILGVTNVDPLRYRLYFERFLHPGRADLPDIDIDICWLRRDEVIDYVYRAYGHDRVAMISSHITFQPRSAFREAAKAFGVSAAEVDRYSRRIPYIYPDVASRSPLRDLISSSPLSRTIPMGEEPYATALPLAERLLNQPHHLSIHPGGIVIADRPIDSYVPLERAAKGIVVTQYDMYSIEDVGLVKIDLLGNRCLTELQETLELAGAEGVRPRLADIPDEDPRAVEILQSACTVGCFQLESPAMRALLHKAQLRNVAECITAVAIIRPGAAAGGAKEAYIRRKRGEEPPAYLHPSLRPLLEENYGVVVYEEDVMCIASAVAGVSLADGDMLRSALKKCRHPDDLRDLENDFLRRAVGNNISPDVARAVWEDLRKFASYCFSKAHASGYGLLAYQSAYLKSHFPVEFACALMNNHAGMYSTRTIAEEMKRLGVRLLHPSVNRSEARFSLERAPGGAGKAVRVGLARVKGLAAESLAAILAARPFASLADFLARADLAKREVEALVLAGAFDDLPAPPGMDAPPNHPQLLWELESTYALHDRGRAAGRPPGEAPELVDAPLPTPDYPPLPAYDPLRRVQNELEVLEMAITGHPLRLLRARASERGAILTTEAPRRLGERVRVAGLLAACRKVRTKKGDLMQFLTLEDEHGLLEATLFPPAHRAFSARLHSLGPYLVEGRVETDHGAINLNVARVEVL